MGAQIQELHQRCEGMQAFRSVRASFAFCFAKWSASSAPHVSMHGKLTLVIALLSFVCVVEESSSAPFTLRGATLASWTSCHVDFVVGATSHTH